MVVPVEDMTKPTNISQNCGEKLGFVFPMCSLCKVIQKGSRLDAGACYLKHLIHRLFDLKT